MTNIVLAVYMACMSQVESGDRDGAHGRAGEVTRWQMLSSLYKGHHPERESEARGWVYKEWECRAEAFCARKGRIPTTKEMALLWHCPARVGHPTAKDKDYAQRFENLVIQLQKQMARQGEATPPRQGSSRLKK